MSSKAPAGEQDAVSPREWLLDQLEERTSVEKPWTSEGHLRQVIQKHSVDVPFGTDAIEPAARALEDEGTLVRWHGKLILVEEKRLRSAIAREGDADQPRRILIGQLNTALQEGSA